MCVLTGEPGTLPVPLAEPQCQAEWRGRYGVTHQNQRRRHCGKPQKEIYG